jgi:protease-4
MFSRRHPFLYFMLVFTAMVSLTLVIIAILVFAGSRETDLKFGEKVGIVEVSGAITDSRQTLDILKRFRRDDSIKAVVLRVDSPGGAVGPSQEIYREIRKTGLVKKVVASLGAVAASGGYYIAAACDGIVANPGTITGSIGVIMGYTNIRRLLDKIGLSPVVIKSGEFKDIGSPVREMTPEERRILEDFADQIHGQFIRDVAEGRGLAVDKVRKVADGRIFSGQKARELGLVDRLGNIDDAVSWAAQMAGIKGEVETVREPREKYPWLKYVTETAARQFAAVIQDQTIFAGYLYQGPASD